MSVPTGLDNMSVAPRLSKAVQKLERWALHQLSETNEPIAWEKINPRTDLNVVPYSKLSSILNDHEKFNALLDKLVVVKLCSTRGRALGTTQPKSLVEIREGHSFIDLAVQQIEVLKSKHNVKVVLMLATSDSTDKSLAQVVKKYDNMGVEIIIFNQTEYPRKVWPVTPKLGEDGGYATNNGDLFAALAYSGKLDELLAQGKEYLFVANADNLGATVDLNILNHLSESQCEYCIEVTPKLVTDVESGAHLSAEGNIELLEFEEIEHRRLSKFHPTTVKMDEKTRTSDHKVLNTNSTWVYLKAVKRLAEIEALDIYCSSKVAKGGEEISYQLQTASGAPLYSVSGDVFENLPIEGNSDLLLVQFFDGGVAINVPRPRFVPVRSTADLLLLQSDLYSLKEGIISKNPLRESDADPVIELEGMKLKKLGDFSERIRNTPSILRLDSLRLVGDVWFGKDVVLQGKVVMWAKQEERLIIPDGDTIKDKLVTAGPEYTDLAQVDLDLETIQWSAGKERDPDIFEEDDFPPCPPDWSDLDMETYNQRKQEVMGKPIWVQDVDEEDLKELGYLSWKSYVIDLCISNW